MPWKLFILETKVVLMLLHKFWRVILGVTPPFVTIILDCPNKLIITTLFFELNHWRT